MEEYIFRKAGQEELEKCIALADLAFGVDFRTLIPKVYGENHVMQAAHYVAEDGDPKGLVAVLDDRLTVEGTVLKTGYVGTVCVHPDFRRKGFMRKLMELAEGDMLANGTDLAFLNGNRQRYQYYGFVPAGVAYVFDVDEDNLTHALKEVSASHVRFEKIDSGSGFEQKARAMYCSGPVHFERTDFAALCRSYRREPYAVLCEGEFMGYIVTNGDKNCWVETCFEKGEHLDMAIKAWTAQNQISDLRIFFPEWEVCLRRHLACYAAGMSRGYSVQARIFRFRSVVDAYLKVKARTCGISDGHMAFDIDGERFEITVKSGNVTVSEGGETPLKLTAYEANRLMLLPMEYEGMPEVPYGWFPLSVYVAPDAPDAF